MPGYTRRTGVPGCARVYPGTSGYPRYAREYPRVPVKPELKLSITLKLSHPKSEQLQCSHTGFDKPHEIALELVCRVENRCKPIGARPGDLFQAFLGPIWPQNLDFQT